MDAITGQRPAGADYPSLPEVEPQRAHPSRGTSPGSFVGECEAELELHITNCGFLMQQAYARFQAYGNPADRDEAVLWMFRRHEAIRSRSQEVQARRHAEFERRLDEGVDFFSVQGGQDRAAMGGAG